MTGRRDYSGAVLVVVHHRNIAFLFQTALYLEALRRLYIFKIDTAEGRSKSLYNLNKLLGILFVDFNVETVETGKNLKQKSFSFHNRLAGESAYITEAENCGSVGNHSHEIALVGVFIDIGRICFNLLAGIGHARRISQSEVVGGGVSLCGNYFNFSVLAFAVIFKRGFFGN